ncbi:hypothetical protein BgiMline_006619, partial [Biomphalaria glabrata]
MSCGGCTVHPYDWNLPRFFFSLLLNFNARPTSTADVLIEKERDVTEWLAPN